MSYTLGSFSLSSDKNVNEREKPIGLNEVSKVVLFLCKLAVNQSYFRQLEAYITIII